MKKESFPKWIIAKKISLYKGSQPVTISRLASQIGISRTHPYFDSILGELIDLKAVIHVETVGSARLLKLNKKKICKYLEETKIYEHLKDYLYEHKPFLAGV